MNQPPNNWGQPPGQAPQGGFQGQQPQQGGYGQAPQGQGGWGQPQAGYPAQPGPGANPYQAPMANPYGGHGQMAPVQPDIKQILFSFEGRIRRTHYWLGALGIAVVYGVVAGIAVGVLGDAGAILLGLAYIPVIWVSLALQVKRWHDRGKSGWWVLINLIPFGGLYTLVECGFLEGDPGPNQYGPPVK